MVTIHYGRAGTGKTASLMSLAKEISKTGGKVCLIVPEQLSMTREYAINRDGIKNAQVYNFSRFANTVFRELGGTADQMPDTAMIVSAVFRAVLNKADELTYYRSVAFSHGFIAKLVSAFSDFDTNCMSETAIMSIPTDKIPVSTRDKYKDLFLLYREYKRLWDYGYKVPGTDLQSASDKLELSDIYADTVFMFDGFYGFTPDQQRLISTLMTVSKDCHFAFTTDLQSDLFTTITKECKKIERLAKKCGQDVVFENAGDTCHRLKTDALRECERTLFDSFNTPEFCEGQTDFTIYSAKTLGEELDFIACKIKNDILSGKYRLRDIAVLMPDADAQSVAVSTVFEKHGVPAFIDIRRTLSSKPLMAFVIAALETAIEGFDYENIFAFVKTGLTGISFDDISIIENYVRVWKIKPDEWQKDKWSASPFGLRRADEQQIKPRLEKINELKDRISKPLFKFKDSLNCANNVRDMLKAIVVLLEDFHVADNLSDTADTFKAQGRLQQYEDSLRIINILVDMLESIECILGDTKLSPRRLCDLLSVCADNIPVTSRPARTDEVTFAGVGRVRVEDKKCIYIPRMNDGVIPAPLTESSLITDADKRLFMQYGIPTSYDFEMSAAREKFDFYSAVCFASHELVFSYSNFLRTGNTILPSDFLAPFKDAKGVNRLDMTDLSPEFFLVSLSALSDTAARTGDVSLAQTVNEIAGYLPVTQKKEADTLSDEIVSAIYSKNLRLSFSGMEQYVECPFKFFLDKGLRISKSETVEFKPNDIGNFIHHGLERLLCETDVVNADDTEISKKLEDIAADYQNTRLADCKGRSRRFDYLFDRAKYALKSATVSVVDEIRSSDFRPLDFEINISEYIPPAKLDKGYTLSLVGSIDRVDIATCEEGRFAKVIDYKSGNQKFSLKKIYNGISMQLPIYAGALKSRFPDIKISAMYYLKVGIPEVKSDPNGFSEQEYAKKFASGYVRDGIFGEVDKLPISLDKSGDYIKIKKDRAVKDSSIDSLIEYSLEKLRDTGKNITDGVISASPIIDGDIDSCKYCDYKSVCKMSDKNELVRKLETPPLDFVVGKEDEE